MRHAAKARFSDANMVTGNSHDQNRSTETALSAIAAEAATMPASKGLRPLPPLNFAKPKSDTARRASPLVRSSFCKHRRRDDGAIQHLLHHRSECRYRRDGHTNGARSDGSYQNDRRSHFMASW